MTTILALLGILVACCIAMPAAGAGLQRFSILLSGDRHAAVMSGYRAPSYTSGEVIGRLLMIGGAYSLFAWIGTRYLSGTDLSEWLWPTMLIANVAAATVATVSLPSPYKIYLANRAEGTDTALDRFVGLTLGALIIGTAGWHCTVLWPRISLFDSIGQTIGLIL